jgi:hypothetical protein
MISSVCWRSSTMLGIVAWGVCEKSPQAGLGDRRVVGNLEEGRGIAGPGVGLLRDNQVAFGAPLLGQRLSRGSHLRISGNRWHAAEQCQQRDPYRPHRSSLFLLMILVRECRYALRQR